MRFTSITNLLCTLMYIYIINIYASLNHNIKNNYILSIFERKNSKKILKRSFFMFLHIEVVRQGDIQNPLYKYMIIWVG